MSTAYDALLVLSFGGPEHPDHVRPFLENVVRGRGVPPERLDAVEQHYLRFGGVSPINAQNRALIEAITREFGRRGRELPIYFGNRNWHPMVEDTVQRMKDDGVRNALVFATSAWGGFSGCRQYDEDITRALAAVGDGAPRLTKLPHFYDHPLFLDCFADAAAEALSALPSGARLVFTAHSIPDAADVNAGPPEVERLYSTQVRDASENVAARLGLDCDVVWQSRSGPAQVPWLEPDICDHIKALWDERVPGAAVVPIGFVSDHLEVIWDLDTEARELAAELGMPFARAATPSADPRFAAMVADLVDDAFAGRSTGLGVSVNGASCVEGCCPAVRRPART
ncbi:ferrochelatase [Tsukamurella pulmonis]|uniref:Coproporphyrin III ferrochelatase n=1 Tax=Tsukamurella pulmonis TaxID=47312 RepID=A0A1H1ET89_9ACTN|nr:ferrochelatase [Tsukamurella pulmonis]KXO91814.1 ferrochelatase [Tsukamurella pulmonis]SDQ91957.1 ferrochelatase [Tsukamurella pulmonis]SUP20516.1 Ferrochelatase [Tsukamurella pulmonis]